jgi:hypothetical protein
MRDHYITAKALAYAIAAIDSLPPERQEWSDRNDMVELLHRMVPGEIQREALALGVEGHFGRPPDLTNWKQEKGQPR